MEWLAKEGYECHVLTTYPYYPQWKVQEPYRSKRFWYSTEGHFKGRVKVYRCPMYVPAEPTGKKRMLSDLSFFVAALFQLVTLIFTKNFDYVISVAPSFQLGLLGNVYKVFRKSKHIYHIQDLQIEVAQELEMIKSEKILNLLYKVEQYIFKKTDVISTISERMVEKVEEKAKKEVVLFPNWEIHFIICGTGPYKTKLETMSKERQLTNVKFLPLQPKDKFNAFLNMADLHLVIQKSKASDLLLPSKLTAILAVGGLALVTADEGSSLHTVVHKFNMGILVETENQALEAGILKAMSPEIGLELKENARAYSEKFLSIDTIMRSFKYGVLN